MYNVWIVDDEPFILEGLYSILDWTELNLRVAGHAESGREAIEKIGGAAVDILITDINMPEMNGLELIRTLKENNPELKCIILSGYNDFEYVKEGMLLGIENYLLKPINTEELKQTLVTTVEKLNRSYNQKLPLDHIEMLRDNILYRWCMSRISREEWKLRSEYLGLKLDAPNVTAVIITPEAESDIGEAVSIRKLAEDFMNRQSLPFLCCQDLDNDTVLLVGSGNDPEYDQERMESTMQSLYLQLSERSGKRICISIGSQEPGLDYAADSYRNALLVQDYALLFPDDPVLTFAKVNHTVSEERKTVPIQFETYADCLQAQQYESLARQIDEDFDAFSRMEGVTPLQLRITASEILIQMKKSLKNAVLFNDSISDAYLKAMSEIHRAATLDKLKSLVKSIAKEMIETLSGDQTSPVIKQVLNYINTSYAEDFSLKTLGQAYRIHPVYLGQLFQKEMNQSFSDYVNSFRIEKAKQLIRQTPMKVPEIANAVGYWDTAYFYKQFKKYTGTSPASYKRYSQLEK
ncbi:response regulator [Paenibacillus tarimensis]